jgi:hypothetical protein
MLFFTFLSETMWKANVSSVSICAVSDLDLDSTIDESFDQSAGKPRDFNEFKSLKRKFYKLY